MAMANELPSLKETAGAAASTGTTQLLERADLLLLFAGLLLGILAVLRPFGTGILFGAILAIAAWPLRDLLLRRGLKRGLVATLLLVLALAVMVLPLMALAPGLGERLTQGAGRLRDYAAAWPPARASARVGAGNRAAATRQSRGSRRTGSPYRRVAAPPECQEADPRSIRCREVHAEDDAEHQLCRTPFGADHEVVVGGTRDKAFPDVPGEQHA